MGFKDELQAEVKQIFSTNWSRRDGNVVPDDKSITIGNDAVELDATVLYADLSDSTKLVDDYKAYFAAEIYKSYLRCAARIITKEGGTVTAYDGDRVMAVYIGNPKNTPAVRTALKITYAVQEIITPAIGAQYPKAGYVPRCVIGIDTSPLFVAKSGVRDANDLVWIGRAANHAAKLTSLPDSHSVYITTDVFNGMRDDVKFSNGSPMWEQVTWNVFGNRIVYRSTWRWTIE